MYNSLLQEPVFSWKSAESYLYGAAFLQDGSIAVSSVQVYGGDLVSGLTMYRLNEETPFAQKQYADEIIHDISFQNGELQVLTDQNAYYYSESGKEKAIVSFQNEPLRMFRSRGEKISALVLGDYREFKSVKLSLLGACDQPGSSVSLRSQVDAIDVSGSRAALLSGNRIEIYNAAGELTQQITPNTEVLFLALGNGYVYYVTPDAVCQEPLS